MSKKNQNAHPITRIIRVFFFGPILLLILLQIPIIPSKPFGGNISEIEIRYKGQESEDITYTVSNKDDIIELELATGLKWSYIVPINSWEGSPSWIIKIHHEDGTMEHTYVDENEFGSSSGRPPQRLLELLMSKYSG